MSPEADGQGPHAMRCMEVRGGTHAVEEALQTPGLDAWVYSRPFEGDEHGGDL